MGVPQYQTMNETSPDDEKSPSQKKESREEPSSRQALRGLRPKIRLAQEMGTRLGACPVLLGPLPPTSSSQVVNSLRLVTVPQVRGTLPQAETSSPLWIRR